MSSDANGNYSLPGSYFVQNGDTVLPVQHNPVFEDVAAALTARVMKDGRTVWTGNMKAGGFKITGLGDGENPQDAATIAQAIPDMAIGGFVTTRTGATALSISAGSAKSDDGAAVITSSSALTIDATTTGNGGLDTGSLAVDTRYYAFVCKGSSGVGCVLSASPTAPTLPSGYDDYKRRVGSVYAAGGAQFRAYSVAELVGGAVRVTYDAAPASTGLTGTDTAQTYAVPAIPAHVVEVRLSARVTRTGGVSTRFWTTGATMIGTTQIEGTNAAAGQLHVVANASGQISYLANNTATNLDIYVEGFLDFRTS